MKNKFFLNQTEPNNLSLKEKLIFLLKDTLFFGGIKGISMVFPLITIPVLTSHFSIKNYGLYENLMIIASFISTFLILAQDSAVARWYYEVTNFEERKKIISTSFLLQIFLIIVLVPFLLWFSSRISLYYYNTAEFSNHFRIIFLLSGPLVLLNFSINILKWTFRRKKFLIVTIMNPLLIFISIIVSKHQHLTLYNTLNLVLVAQILSSIIAISYTLRWISFSSFSFFFLKKLFIYGIPLCLISLSAAILPLIDRKFIVDVLSFDDLGNYSLAYKIGGFYLIFEGIFQMAWGPFSLSIFKEKDAQKVYNIIFKLYVFFSIIIIGIISEFSIIITELIGNFKYESNQSIIFLILISFSYSSLNYLSNIGINLSLKSYLHIISHLFSLIVFTLSLYYFVSSHGLVGVGFSLVLSSISKFIAGSVIARMNYKKIIIKWERPSLIFSLWIIFYFLALKFDFNYLLKFSSLAFVFILIYKRKEIRAVKNFF